MARLNIFPRGSQRAPTGLRRACRRRFDPSSRFRAVARASYTSPSIETTNLRSAACGECEDAAWKAALRNVAPQRHRAQRARLCWAAKAHPVGRLSPQEEGLRGRSDERFATAADAEW